MRQRDFADKIEFGADRCEGRIKPPPACHVTFHPGVGLQQVGQVKVKPAVALGVEVGNQASIPMRLVKRFKTVEFQTDVAGAANELPQPPIEQDTPRESGLPVHEFGAARNEFAAADGKVLGEHIICMIEIAWPSFLDDSQNPL